MKLRLALILFFLHLSAARADIRFSAETDQSSISMDESVSLKITVDANAQPGNIGVPQFNAPDFDVISSYPTQATEHRYENGQFSVQYTQSLTSVLRPKRKGKLTINGIQISIAGKTYTAAPITVEVVPGGQATPPPRGYGGGIGLGGSGKRQDTRPFFIRAELNTNKAYKGQQIIVSYSIYSKYPLSNLDAVKFPQLKGFLKEELDMPITQPNRPSEIVTLDGQTWRKSLLLRFAAYPLQEGKLTVDSLVARATYFPKGSPGSLLDDDDDGNMLFKFFGQMAPRTFQETSEQVSVEVLPLPPGAPAGFAGAVGSFELTSALDRYQLNVNEPVVLKILIQGRGNLANQKKLDTSWPKELELFDSKDATQTDRGGVTRKSFEYTLLPKAPGKITIPPLSFSYFSPEKKSYVTLKSDPFTIEVGGVASPDAPKAPNAPVTSKEPAKPLDLQGWKDEQKGESLPHAWRWLGTLAVMLLLFVLGWAIRDDRMGRQKALGMSESDWESQWKELQGYVGQLQGSSVQKDQVFRAYEKLIETVLVGLERRYQVPARSVARQDLVGLLKDKEVSLDLWEQLVPVLEYAERVCFAGEGAVSQDDAIQQFSKKLEIVRQCMRSG